MTVTEALMARALRVQADLRKRKEPATDYTPAMKDYFNFRKVGVLPGTPLRVAMRIFGDPIQKEICEAMLLAEADPTDIEEAFGIPADGMEVYKELFFDTKAFATKLDRISYIENYEDPFGKELKVRAFSLGPEFVYFKYGNLLPRTDKQRELVKRMFMSSAYRAMEANFNPIGSQVSKQALEWSKNMLKAYEALEKLLSQEGASSGDLAHFLLNYQDTLSVGVSATQALVSKDDII